MPVVAVVGGQWGDEGKGKVVDLLAESANVVARAQGGNNAGHTVKNALGEFRLHLVPSGVFYPDALCVIGSGVVIDPKVLLGEIDSLLSRGVQSAGRLIISDRAHVIMPYHRELDRLEEQSRGSFSIGTTGRGIGPAYSDKVARSGIRMIDLIDRDALREALETRLPQKNLLMQALYGAEPMSLDSILEEYSSYGERLAPYVGDAIGMVHAVVASGGNLLLEGAQGTMLDLDYGTYPFVTSSSPIAGGSCVGTGLPPSRVDQAIGVFKAYVTRVGKGPFPTELNNEIGDAIRELGHEYGTTTGRPRRIGWFDAVVGRYAVRLSGLTGLAITRLDILDTQPSLKICVGYELEGSRVETPPARLSEFAKCQPVYEEMPGWQRPTSGARRLDDLPTEARRYVERISELLETPLSVVSVGSAREETILLQDPFGV